MSNLHVKKGDTVVLLTGKYNDKKTKDGAMKTGKVVEVSPKEGKVIVEGINMVTKHMKPNRMGQKGAIVNAEAPIYACKVQVVCPKCGKPTRVGYQAKEKGAKDRVRVCKKCGEAF